MIYAQHNFYGNFANAAGTEDNEAVRDIFLDELSDIIIENPNQVSLALSESGLPVQGTVTRRKLIDKLVDNLNTNMELRHKLAGIIVRRHPEVGQIDQEFANVEPVTITAIGSALSNIAGKLFGKKKDNVAPETQVAKEQTKRTLLQLVSNKMGRKEGISAGAAIGIVLAIFVLTGTIIYLFTRKPKRAS